MRLLNSIYDRVPAIAFLLAIVAILATAYLGDRADNARYLDECRRFSEPRGQLCSVGR